MQDAGPAILEHGAQTGAGGDAGGGGMRRAVASAGADDPNIREPAQASKMLARDIATADNTDRH